MKTPTFLCMFITLASVHAHDNPAVPQSMDGVTDEYITTPHGRLRVIGVPRGTSTAIFYFPGDIPNHLSAQQLSAGFEAQVRLSAALSRRLNASLYAVFPPGMYGSDDINANRRSGIAYEDQAIAVNTLIARTKPERSAILGHSGGAVSAVASLAFNLSINVKCVYAVSGVYNVRLHSEFRSYIKFGNNAEDYTPTDSAKESLGTDMEEKYHIFEVDSHLSDLVIADGRRLIFAATRADIIAPFASSDVTYSKLKSVSPAVELIDLTRETKSHYETLRYASDHISECLRNNN